MNRLLSMQVFCRVVDCQGFASAARTLDMSPPVVTRLISDLETHLSARLLNRSTSRKLVLTEAGRIYLEQVRRILADIEEAEASVQSATQRVGGRLKVLAPPSLATYELVRIIHSFKQKHPKLTIELTTTAQAETLDEGFDVCVVMTHARPLNGDFVARRLAHSQLVLCGSPDYLKSHGRPLHPKDLMNHALVTLPFVHDLTFRRPPASPRDSQHEERYALAFSQVALSTTQLETARSAALQGLGLVVLPSFVAAPACASGELQSVLTDWSLPALNIHAAIPTREHVPAKTQAFLDHLVQAFPDSEKDPWLGRCIASAH
jgi:DNA-binding transcriptional LysR family regulator